MNDDDGGTVFSYRGAKYFCNSYHRGVYIALVNLLNTQNFVFCVEQNYPQVFLVQQSHFSAKKIEDVLGRTDDDSVFRM